MVAMTEARRVKARMGEIMSRPIAANTRIFQGALVCMAAGVAVNGATATGLIADGIARETVDNTGGAAGALRIESQPGQYYFANSAAGDAITLAEVGTDCFIVDNQTVAKTNGGGTRSRAGKIIDVDASGVLVAIGITL